MKWFCTMLMALIATNTYAAEAASTAEQALTQLQQRWAVAKYELTAKPQEQAFEQLLKDADGFVGQFSSQAEIYLWRGIIKSTYAGVQGGLGALKLAKSAKQDLEHSVQLDATAQQGSAYTSLGALYFNVPGWPIGFGDNDKAEQLLKQALTLNPDGIDSNFFYADYLRREKRYQEARHYFEKAQAAAPRPGRELADSGRQAEIQQALAELAKKLR